ncbi:hypothetical protein [Polaribacter atrinae]|uniref:fibronectin type III domain-containing protein n=1 Tax=Polaribacter atrinae TaxID=1333662 RepID=UPI0030FA10C5
MKHIQKYIVLLLILFMYMPYIAQEKAKITPSSNINIVDRYKDNAVELIYFPDKNKALYQGLKKGFLVERAELNDSIFSLEELKFKKLDEVFPYTEENWKKALATSNEEEKKNLNLAKEFYDNREVETGGQFSFDKGIKEMKEQKFKEDFAYLLFVMNAIKDNKVAKALGLSYTDKTAELNKKYVYRISLNEAIDGYSVKEALSVIEIKKEEETINREIFVKTWDSKLTFIWEENDMVSGAFIERKNNVTGVFELLNKNPVLNSSANSVRNSYTDSNLTNYTTYEYQFYGMNPFGEKVYFGKAKGIPRDLTPPVNPSITMAKHVKPEEIKIAWKMQIEQPDLKGFVVARSEKNKGNFQLLHSKLLPKNIKSYTDKTFNKEKDNYYVVQAIDTAGNISSSSPYLVTIIDSIPPLKPKFISGKIDSLGVVTIDIDLNKERDLMGYRLYRSNSAEHEFSVINEGFHEKDTIFTKAQNIFKDTVTINSLTPYIYYKIKALDYNFNQSEYSDILKVKRPDIIPPTTPVFKKVKVGKDNIELSFVLSKSEDVANHYLYRKLKIDANWELLANIENNATKYKDEKLKQGAKYYYSLRAKDDSELFSEYANPVYGKPYDDGLRDPVTNLTILKNKEAITLKWDYKKINENTFFVIYKKNKKGNLVQYKSITELNYIENFKNEKTVEYAVKAFTKDGGQSKISETVSITKD